MVAVALVLVAEHYHSWWITLPAAARSPVKSSFRRCEWMAEIGKRSSVAVSWIGKVKTMAQMMSLVGLLWRPDRSVEYVAIGLLYIAAVLTFWSMFQYLNAARNDLLEP